MVNYVHKYYCTSMYSLANNKRWGHRIWQIRQFYRPISQFWIMAQRKMPNAKQPLIRCQQHSDVNNTQLAWVIMAELQPVAQYLHTTVNLSISAQSRRWSMKLISNPRSLYFGAIKILTVTSFGLDSLLFTWNIFFFFLCIIDDDITSTVTHHSRTVNCIYLSFEISVFENFAITLLVSLFRNKINMKCKL